MLINAQQIEQEKAMPGERRYGDILEAYDPDKAITGKSFALVGYATHQGAVRNDGRGGSGKGPDRIRQEFSRLYVHHEAAVYDGGTVADQGEPLEVLQEELRLRVEELQAKGLTVIVLGGDHSLAWPHYQAVAEGFGEAELSILNLDAHFDMRDNPQANSGTSFYQILQRRKKQGLPFVCQVIGISEYTNSRKLFDLAYQERVRYQLFDEMDLDEIRFFILRSSHLYLNVCMDVISSGIAPGVSAADPLGLSAREVYEIIKIAARSGKVKGFGIAETAPAHDEDNSTAKLAARYAAAFIQYSMG